MQMSGQEVAVVNSWGMESQWNLQHLDTRRRRKCRYTRVSPQVVCAPTFFPGQTHKRTIDPEAQRICGPVRRSSEQLINRPGGQARQPGPHLPEPKWLDFRRQVSGMHFDSTSLILLLVQRGPKTADGMHPDSSSYANPPCKGNR
jgi:hypothetical protein